MHLVVVHGRLVEHLTTGPVRDEEWECILCGRERAPYMASYGWVACEDCWKAGRTGSGSGVPGIAALRVYANGEVHWRKLNEEEQTHVALLGIGVHSG